MGVAVIAALLLASLTQPAGAVTYEPEPPFCKRAVIRDLLSPFDRMPHLRQPSKTGQIGFGPSSLRIRTTPQLNLGEGGVGFTLSVARREGLNLPWTATTTIVEVNGNGRPIGKPHRSIKKVGRLKQFRGDRFQFNPPDDPAFYRTTILFTGPSDQKLGRFSFYTRVMRPTIDARLALNASTYRPESTVFLRVANFGTLRVAYGVPYSIERLEAGSWAKAPESPDGPWILPIRFTPPGHGGSCAGFWIPPSMPSGHYRVVKPIGIGIREQTNLTAEFDIVL